MKTMILAFAVTGIAFFQGCTGPSDSPMTGRSESGVAGAGGTGKKVIIGVPNWPSARARAYIFKSIIENNLALEVEMQTGSNAVIFEALDKGAMHLHPETSSPNHNSLINKYAKNQTIREGQGEKTKGMQGICVTKGTVERTKISHISQLTDPEMAKKFDRNGDGVGDIWIGAAGWGSTTIEKIRAKSYGYDQIMNTIVMEEAIGLANLDSAVKQKENIVFSCYAPHYVFFLYDLVVLKEPPHDPDNWKILFPHQDSAWLEKSFAASAWEAMWISLHYAASLEKSHPQVAKIFSRASFSIKDLEDMAHRLGHEKVPPETYARQWLKKNTTLVDSWLR